MGSMKENTGEAVLEYMKEKIVSGEWPERKGWELL